MCLDNVTKVYKKPSVKHRKAFKVFRLSGSNNEYLTFPYNAHKGNTAVYFGTWLSAPKDILDAENYDSKIKQYPAGFHCLRTKASAMKYAKNSFFDNNAFRIVPVIVGGVMAEGTQKRTRVIVAKYLFVPKQKEAK